MFVYIMYVSLSCLCAYTSIYKCIQVHLAHAYNESEEADRVDKMLQSLTTIGVSVLSGAISTLMASMMVLKFVYTCTCIYIYAYVA